MAEPAATPTTTRAQEAATARTTHAQTTAAETEDAPVETPHQILLADAARLRDVFDRDAV